MKSKNELNALIIQHGKELDIAKMQMEADKLERDRQKYMEILEKEEEWASVKQEVSLYHLNLDLQ